MASANRVALGTAIDGSVSEGDVDYFAVQVPPDVEGEIVVGVVVTTGDVIVTIFDDADKPS